MEYRKRLIEDKILLYARTFPCVLLSGARQVGKSTTLSRLFPSHRAFVFDPVQDIYGVKPDPDLFLRNNPSPLILDEIQYVPELVPAIKRYVDAHRVPGQFLITGSQQWHVMRHMAESLAGRVAMLDLHGFSMGEVHARTGHSWLCTWLNAAPHGVDAAAKSMAAYKALGVSATEVIWRGGFPDVVSLPGATVSGWMQGYVTTYLQRDVRLLVDVRDETQFATFLALCAALTAQEINYAHLGRDLGLSSPAAKRWLGVLRGTYQWFELPAYSTNLLKRLSGRPKGHITDTGLACYLMRISSPDALQGHPAFGALFETFSVMECIKQLQSLPLVPAMAHCRQHSGAEVDLLIEMDGNVFPIEIKASSRVSAADTRSMAALRERLGERVQPGLVIYAGRETLRIGDSCLAVPFDLAECG